MLIITVALKVEAPIKPEEQEIEQAMYDHDKHFTERIELAIQRFKQSKRMHQKYAQIFNAFMGFGGVETGQSMFQGISREDIKSMDAEQITRAKATQRVPDDRANTKLWTVDFVGVAEAFL